MSLPIVGNIDLFEESSIFKFEKNFNTILSKHQTLKKQNDIIKRALNDECNFDDCVTSSSSYKVFSFVFVLTQFGKTSESKLPPNFLDYKNNPYIFKTKKNEFLIPWEIIDYISTKKIFDVKNYLFAKMQKLSKANLESWYFWINQSKDHKLTKSLLRYKLYSIVQEMQSRLKSSILEENETEKENCESIELKKLWNENNPIMKSFYKSEINFYDAMCALEKKEISAKKKEILSLIKSGKLVPNNLKYKNKISLIFTAESIFPKFQKDNFNYHAYYYI